MGDPKGEEHADRGHCSTQQQLHNLQTLTSASSVRAASLNKNPAILSNLPRSMV